MIAIGNPVCKPDAGPRSANSDAQLQGDARTAWERSLLRSKVGRGPKLVLQALLHYTWGKPDCWPSNRSLADETEYSVREVQRHIRELERQGVIVVEVDRSLSTQRRITFPSHPHAHCKDGLGG